MYRIDVFNIFGNISLQYFTSNFNKIASYWKATWHYIAIRDCIIPGTWPPWDRLP